MDCFLGRPGAAGTLEADTPFTLTASAFEQIRRLAYQNFGLDLKEGKQGLVVARLGKALRQHGFTSFEQYCRHVAADSSGDALAEMADALTTNFTGFLRESSHFDFLRANLCPRSPSQGVFEIWSAASSTGEEPYSILFTALEALGLQAEVRVVASDISTRALAGVREAIYTAASVEGLPAAWTQKYFLRGTGGWHGWYRVKPEYRARVQARRFNLITDALPAARYPAIFCRNVMIYFDKPTQSAVVRRLASRLEPGGLLFTGHSESLTGVDHGLEYVQPAVYRAPGKGKWWPANPNRSS